MDTEDKTQTDQKLKAEGKTTLSLGKKLEDLKKSIEKKERELNSKVLQVVGRTQFNKPTVKLTEPEVSKVKKPYFKEELKSFQNVKSGLTNVEQEHRKQVLELSKAREQNQEDPSFKAEQNNRMTKFEVVDTRTSKGIVEPDVPTLSKKESGHRVPSKVSTSYKEKEDSYSEEDEQDQTKGLKKPLGKKKEKNKNWKDVYFSDDSNNLIKDDIGINEEEDQSVSQARKPVDNSAVNRPNSDIYKPVANLKRVGKTKRDKSFKKYQIGSVKKVLVLDQQKVIDLADKLSTKIKIVMNFLKQIKIEATPESMIDGDTAELLVAEMGHESIRNKDYGNLINKYHYADKEEQLKHRPPVITIMGHVDHGKTSLLDYIRKTNVAGKESGGITQHIGAYKISTDQGREITFLDTPGHEAFYSMRARGAVVTDIVILVVAADDGVKPQTAEAINHAQSANVPIIVAINKIDKSGSNIPKVKTELLKHKLLVEDLGGEVLCNEISAKSGAGIPELLDTILLQADISELKSNPSRSAIGVIIETKIEKGKGFVATVLVKNGKLKKGDFFVCGLSSGKVRLLINDLGVSVNTASASMPVEVIGFSKEVSSGDDFTVVDSELDANQFVSFRLDQKKIDEKKLEESSEDTIGALMESLEDDKQRLSIILKADVHGSKEAILSSLKKIKHAKGEIKVIHSGIGQINESDVLLAKTSGALIYGFNVRPNSQAKTMSARDKVEIRHYAIIYDLLDDVKGVLTGLLTPNVVENILGYATIKEVFDIGKIGKIAGCTVIEGVIRKDSKVRVLRNNTVIYEGSLEQLKRYKDDAAEVKHGFECGIMLKGFQDLLEGDKIECFDYTYEKQVIE